MKVCTDACLFGAWVAHFFEENKIQANKLMDIGCGTGLLSLMLAQKTKSIIDALEIDADAYLQATENIEASIFKNNIHTFHGPVELFAAHSKYDFIICNPPFYENQLKSNNKNRNAAMHEATLDLETLYNCIENNLSINGNVAILLPFDRMLIFEEILSSNGFFVNQKANVKHSPNHPYFRSMIIASKIKDANLATEICIKNATAQYTPEFIGLLKDFYLNF